MANKYTLWHISVILSPSVSMFQSGSLFNTLVFYKEFWVTLSMIVHNHFSEYPLSIYQHRIEQFCVSAFFLAPEWQTRSTGRPLHAHWFIDNTYLTHAHACQEHAFGWHVSVSSIICGRNIEKCIKENKCILTKCYDIQVVVKDVMKIKNVFHYGIFRQ